MPSDLPGAGGLGAQGFEEPVGEGGGGEHGGGVNNFNSPPRLPVPVPLVHHHFPLPLVLNPP